MNFLRKAHLGHFVFLVIITGLFFIVSAQASELEKTLSKNDFFKTLTEKIGSDANLNKGSAAFQTYLEQKKASPSEEAKMFYQEDVNSQPCPHCPKYLNLTLEVNKIVEKINTDKSSIAESNEKMIQLNKLKFMYYIVRSENDNGEVRCQKLNDQTLFNPIKLDGNIKLLSENMLSLPNVTSIQYIPQGKEEVYYYYRGEGASSNVIIEVVMSKDGSSKIRYYSYEDTEKLVRIPDLGISGITVEQAREDNYAEFKFDVKMRNAFVPTDINFLSAGYKTQLLENLNFTAKNEANFNEQVTKVSLANDNGMSWVELEGKNVINGSKGVTTRLPVEITLAKDSNLKLGGSLENNFSVDDISKLAKLSNYNQSEAVQLGLTDHNNEYFNVKAITNDNHSVTNYSVSNRYSVGDKSSVGASYEENIINGQKKFSINTVADFKENGKLTTSFGQDNENRFVQTQYERKISARTSMILIVKTDDNRNNSVMYQLESKF